MKKGKSTKKFSSYPGKILYKNKNIYWLVEIVNYVIHYVMNMVDKNQKQKNRGKKKRCYGETTPPAKDNRTRINKWTVNTMVV